MLKETTTKYYLDFVLNDEWHFNSKRKGVCLPAYRPTFLLLPSLYPSLSSFLHSSLPIPSFFPILPLSLPALCPSSPHFFLSFDFRPKHSSTQVLFTPNSYSGFTPGRTWEDINCSWDQIRVGLI